MRKDIGTRGEAAGRILHLEQVQKDRHLSSVPLQEISGHHAGCHRNSFFLPPARMFARAMPICL